MNTPNLSAAVAQQRWDVAAHLLVYGLIKTHINGNHHYSLAAIGFPLPLMGEGKGEGDTGIEVESVGDRGTATQQR